MTPEKPVHPRRAEAAFSLVELLVALVIGSAVLVTVAVAFGTFTSGPRSKLGRETVTLGATAMQELYGMGGATISVSTAPSYGSRILADQMRDMFWDDVRHANAVFCLGRNGRNSVRPLTIPIAVPGRFIDTPGRFLEVLSEPAAYPAAAAIFANYRNVSAATNGSIFILEPAEQDDITVVPDLAVRAIYEIDFVQTANPAGTYATVQRYATDGGNPPVMVRVAFYDIFYPDSDDPIVNDFSPLFVFFERQVLLAVDGDEAADPFKVAVAAPFFMIWWPDPTSLTLEAVVAAPAAATDPRSQYGAMGGMTSYFFVVPMTPSL